MIDDREEIERMRLESHWAGRASSLEELEAELKQRAGAAYAAGRDQEAGWLRDMAIFVGKRALDDRKRQKDFSPKHSGGV